MAHTLAPLVGAFVSARAISALCSAAYSDGFLPVWVDVSAARLLASEADGLR